MNYLYCRVALLLVRSRLGTADKAVGDMQFLFALTIYCGSASSAFAQPPGGDDFIIQLMPILLIWLILGPLAWYVGRRKGIGITMRLIGSFPIWAGFFLIYWASLTDKTVLDRLKRLGDVAGMP